LQIAIFITVTKGFRRTKAQDEKKTADHVFPGNFEVAPTAVQRLINGSIGGGCPAGTPEEVLQQLLSKSTHTGGTTDMFNFPRMNE
jgi:hypothetical protein